MCCGRTTMSRIHNRILVALALVFVLALPLRAEDDESRFEVKYGKNFTFSGGQVSIDHGFGELTIRTHNSSQVQVRATIRSSDEEIGKEIRIVAGESAAGVTIRTEFPEIRRHRGNLSYSVDMTVTMPANAPLTAKNRFGSTDVRGLHAASTIENKQGSIAFAEGRGTHSLSNAFGSIELTDNQGDVTVSNSNGSISIRKINGTLNANNRFGSVSVADVERAATITNSNGSIEALDIGGMLTATNAFGSITASTIGASANITTSNARVELSNVTGSATVKNSFGTVTVKTVSGNLTVDGSNSKVEAEGITGNATVDTGFGGVTLHNIGGWAKVSSNNGNVKVSDIAGALTAATQFGSVKAERVRGAADVKSTNGSITLNEIGGAAKVRASFGPVFLDGVGGAVDVTNGNGAISVSGMRSGPCQPVALRTSFSSIKVTLPENSSYAVNARTSFGRVNSQIPILTTGMAEGTLVGTIGKGGCKLDLANSNGNITIEKE